MNRPLDSELHAWVDGQLDASRLAAVTAWLAQHPEDQEQLMAWRRQKELLHSAFDPALDEQIPARLGDLARRRAPPRVWRAAAAIGWLAIGISTGYVLRGTAPSDIHKPPTLVRNAAIAHVVYVPEVRHPVEVGADQESHLIQWLSKRLGMPLKTPKFDQQGFSLIGGRLLPDDRGAVAQFMYEDKSGRRLTLYIRTDPDNRDTAFRFAQEGKVSVFYWLDHKVGYALSSELPREQLLAIAETAYRQLSQN